MDVDGRYAPFPGALAAPTNIRRPDVDVGQRHQVVAVPDTAYQHATAQMVQSADPPAAQPARRRPSMLAPPGPVSVVLGTSPIKVHEYSEYNVTIQDDATAENGPPRNKRGRPKGWRAAHSSSTMLGSPGARPAVTVGRPGRQKQTPNYSLKRRRKTVARPESPPPRELYLALKPTYTGFLCEWSGCKAELHNMDTLRRHIYVVHLRPQRQHRCLWGKCGQMSVAQQFDGEALATHLEQLHLVPMSWHIGDGPRNRWDWSIKLAADRETVPDFLKDRDGNQVTPSTREQEVEDLPTYRSNRRKLKELIMRRDENLESQSSGTSEGEAMGSGL
ncbi:hypothetical protein V2A60_004933 [Cordyceps javanica]